MTKRGGGGMGLVRNEETEKAQDFKYSQRVGKRKERWDADEI